MHVHPNKKDGSRLVRDIFDSIINKSIDLLAVEHHLLGYQYCGAGSKLAQCLQSGDPGINKLNMCM